MNYLALKNERTRRRQARLITFLVTTATLTGVVYGVGGFEQLAEAVQHLFAAPAPVDTTPVAGLL
jgi:hypothetical protein